MGSYASDEAEKIVQPVKAGVREAAAGAREAAGELAADARERAEGLLRRTRERAVQTEERLEDYVRDHPLRSVLIASGVGAGLGLVFGILLARR